MVRKIESGVLERTPITENSCLRQKLYPEQDTSKDPNDWCNNYDKILVERTIMDRTDLASTILRLPAVYGPRDNQHRFSSYLNLKRMMDKRPFIIMDESFANWRWAHSYVENVALAIVLALIDNRSSGRIFNVGEPVAHTIIDYVHEIGKKLGWDGEIVLAPKKILPEFLKFPLDTTQQLVMDSRRIREELGYNEKVSWDDGLIRTIEWELENPPKKNNPKYRLEFDYEKEDEVLKEIGRR
ncbi:NAD-dependent epimerase/dehydratase family protein [Paenibacillus eucommiae]|uniref:Nucleoside-diphosphate-sugar epimerase n=1 Tax=Paenibacillus eucommiae TaxID=1355755 RepID=A0ABS4JCY4_9BACL|nr:NAD(P)-dependent oxidoreductase [Paenibacillus eucommiae]MBP1996941.1 nucleoside-diphosphate-sugar epimerase [Paenibacillus eucommiae]